MNQEARLLRGLDEGHSALVDVPSDVDIHHAADTLRNWGRTQGRELSIVTIVTDEDQKLAVGPGAMLAKSLKA